MLHGTRLKMHQKNKNVADIVDGRRIGGGWRPMARWCPNNTCHFLLPLSLWVLTLGSSTPLPTFQSIHIEQIFNSFMYTYYIQKILTARLFSLTLLRTNGHRWPFHGTVDDTSQDLWLTNVTIPRFFVKFCIMCNVQHICWFIALH